MKISGTLKATAFASVFLANMASAGIPEAYAGNPLLEALNQQLIAEGFEIVSIKTTFLWRLKIEAHAPGIDREIVLAPGTGAILRDDQVIVALEDIEVRLERDTTNDDSETPNSEPADSGMDAKDNDTENGDVEDHGSDQDSSDD